MSRPLPDANDHHIALSKPMQKITQRACLMTRDFKIQCVYLFRKDYDRIESELRGAGFDVARGFKINGVKTRRHTE